MNLSGLFITGDVDCTDMFKDANVYLIVTPSQFNDSFATMFVNRFYGWVSQTNSIHSKSDIKSLTEYGPNPTPDPPKPTKTEVKGEYNFITTNNVLTIYSALVGYTKENDVITSVDIPWLNDTNVTKVNILGPITSKSDSLQTLFNGLSNCVEITGLEYVDLTNVINISSLFNGCLSLESVKCNDVNILNYIGLKPEH